MHRNIILLTEHSKICNSIMRDNVIYFQFLCSSPLQNRSFLYMPSISNRLSDPLRGSFISVSSFIVFALLITEHQLKNLMLFAQGQQKFSFSLLLYTRRHNLLANWRFLVIRGDGRTKKYILWFFLIIEYVCFFPYVSLREFSRCHFEFCLNNVFLKLYLFRRGRSICFDILVEIVNGLLYRKCNLPYSNMLFGWILKNTMESSWKERLTDQKIIY